MQFRRNNRLIGNRAIQCWIAPFLLLMCKLLEATVRKPILFFLSMLTLLLLLASPWRTAITAAGGTETPVPVSLTEIVATTTDADSTVTANAQWTPQYQDFNGVTMARVPPGCFIMGTAPSASSHKNESPTTQICFDKPFWIDKTDVTQDQFKRLGGIASHSPSFTSFDAVNNLPVENISWFEARDFCTDKRGARLPTEAEWEYAARGPDSLVYPWGNTFVADNVDYDSSAQETAVVGSKPAGASWVGALDMSGNVQQWVSTLYKPYPYDPTDGRENNDDLTSPRVFRGGSWYDVDEGDVRAAKRDAVKPNVEWYIYGFRCARSDQIDTPTLLTTAKP